jgi:hypothetical protein
MRVLDSIGNELHEGDTIFWKQTGQVCKVMASSPGGVIDPNTNQESPGLILLGVPIGFNSQKGKDVSLSDFLCVRDPQAQSALEKVAESVNRGHRTPLSIKKGA